MRKRKAKRSPVPVTISINRVWPEQIIVYDPRTESNSRVRTEVVK